MSSSPSSPSPTDPVPASSTPAETPSTPNTQYKFDIGEEYGTARKNLPPTRILLICIAIVAVAVIAYSFTHRAHALSSGTIDDIVSVPVPGQNMIMIAVNISLQNNSQKASVIHTIQVSVDTPSGKFTDDATPATDVQRYFQALPDLKQHALNILTTESTLEPGRKVSGTIVSSFPITADAFAARKSLTITVAPYDEVPVVITK